MKTSAHRLVILVCFIFAVWSYAPAAPTGLNIITTADMLGDGEVALEYQNDGLRLFSSECNQWTLFQVGLLDRFELGVDRCFEGDQGTFGNIKALIQPENGSRPAVALGVQNLGEGSSSQPYLVLARDVAKSRLHVGAIRVEDETEAMFGIEYQLAEPVLLSLDGITGRQNFTGAGVAVELPYGLSLSLARIFANSADEDDSWQLIASLAASSGF